MADEQRRTWPRRALIAIVLAAGLTGAGYGISAAATSTPSPSGPSTGTPAPTHHCPNM
jgi:hypothetical protein